MKKAIILTVDTYANEINVMNNAERIEWYNKRNGDDIHCTSLSTDSFVSMLNCNGFDANEFAFTLEYDEYDEDSNQFSASVREGIVETSFAQYDEFICDFMGCVSLDEFCEKMKDNNLYTFDNNLEGNHEVYYKEIKVVIGINNIINSVTYFDGNEDSFDVSHDMFMRVGCDTISINIDTEKEERKKCQVEPIKIKSLDNMVEIPISQEAESEATPDADEKEEAQDDAMFNDSMKDSIFQCLEEGEDVVLYFCIKDEYYYLNITADNSYDQYGFFLYSDNYRILFSEWVCGIDKDYMFDDIAHDLPIKGKIDYPVNVSPKIFARFIK